MTVSVLHQKVSAIADDPASVAAGEVVPSDWNAEHTISGVLEVANGGTGVTTSTGTGSVVLSNSPTLFTPALGTPSSGVVTNLTGTASININGTVGATTPTTGAFTTINASSTSTLTGNVGIGNPPTNDALRVSGTASGSTFINGVLLDEMVGSGVTSAYRSVLSRPILENATFTLNNLYHFYANPQTKPAAATLSNQYGFFAESTLTDATVNYGFYGNIASGANRYNFYAAGTAANYFAGNSTFNTGLTVNGTTNLSALTASTALALDASKNIVSVTNTGSGNNVLATSPTLITPNLGTPSAITLTNATGTASININGTVGATTPASGAFTTLVTSDITVFNGAIGNAIAGTEMSLVGTAPTNGGTSAFGAQFNPTGPTNATNQIVGVRAAPNTPAGAFTVNQLISFNGGGGTLGAGSTATQQIGFFVGLALTSGTSCFAFSSNLAAATNRWNFYASGTAPNYFAGNTFIGATTGDQALNVNGAVRVANTTTANQTSAATMDFTSGALRFLSWGASGTQGTIQWWTGSGALGATQRMTLTGSNNLGLATATFGTSATNTFSVANGTAPTTGVADTVQYYSSDLSAGNTIPSWYTEGTNVGTGTPTADRTIAVRFNGTVYYLLASTIP